MTSSPTSTVRQQRPQDAPLAASAGKRYTPKRSGSPIDAWMDLMEAVEALCPHWPERTVSIGVDYRL